MPTRPPYKTAVLIAALAAAACSSAPEPKGCRSDDQCPADARCQESACVAQTKPVASVRPVAAVDAFSLVELDGSESRGAGGATNVAEHLWTVRSLTAPCAPPEIAGVQPIARVRFGCPGRYEVSLAVRDLRGLESAPATTEVEVIASRQAPSVAARPDVAVEHSCSGDPLVCRPAESVVLSAATAVPGAELRWTVEPPPDLPLDDGTRRVWLASSTIPGAATAHIETDGTAISGDWIFRVEARDPYGVVGVAFTRVSIRNRPPVVLTDAPVPFPHVFDAAGSRFVSSGELGWSAYDPDGDPLEVAATWRHVADGGAPFTGELSPGKVTFAIEVPYATPEDALALRGGAGLARTIEFAARDVNRGEGHAYAPIQIGNRPPVPTQVRAGVVVPHGFDLASSRYVSVAANLGTWMDLDGDPMFGVASDAPCDRVSVVDGTVSVVCSAPYGGTPAVERIAGTHSVRVRVRDAWEEGGGVLQDVTVLNAAPSLSVSAEGTAQCWVSGNGGSANACAAFIAPWGVNVGALTFTARPAVFDPDGDPVAVVPEPYSVGSASPTSAVCTNGSCVAFQIHQPALQYFCPFRDPPPTRVAATDGAAWAEARVMPALTGCPH